MKPWTMIAGAGMTAGLVFLMACGGEKGAGSGAQPAATPAPSKPSAAVPSGKDAAAAKPALAAPAKKPPFSAEMSEEFMRKVMETSARIEAVKKEIAERQKVIFETNPEVKAYRAQLIEMQKEINKIMDADAELAELKLNRDMLWSTMPILPRGNPRAGPARGFGPMR